MQLFFRQEGLGFPFVILHGLYGSSDNWISIGKKLASRFKVFMVDQRNHGRSPHEQEHTYKLMKEDLSEFFINHQIERAIVLGHSMGGKTAMYFAADYPEKIEKLVVVDIAPKNYLLEGNQSHYLSHKNILQAMMDCDFRLFNSRMEIGNYLLTKINQPEIVQFLLKNISYNKESGLPFWRLNVNALYKHLDDMVSGVDWSLLDDYKPMVNYPILFIKGSDSNYISDVDIPKLKELYPYSKIEEIKHAGHWPHAEQPEAFLETLGEFC